MYGTLEEANINDPIPISIGIPINFEKPNFNKFLLNVFTLLMFQFLIISSFAYIGYYYREYFINNFIISLHLTIYSSLIFIMSLFNIICCSFKNKYILYVLFLISTISSSIFITIIILPYSSNVIILSSIGTLICLFISIIYLSLSSIYIFDIFNIGLSIICISISTIPIAFIQLFILDTCNILHFILAFIIIIIFNIYLIYDIQIIYNSNDYIIFKSPIYPAIYIYLDIINIFIYLLQCINIIETKN